MISAWLLTRQSVPPVDPRVSRLGCPRAQPVRLRTVYIVRTQALNAVQPAFLEWGRVFRARVPRVPRVLWLFASLLELMLDRMPSDSSSHLANEISSHSLMRAALPESARATPHRVCMF